MSAQPIKFGIKSNSKEIAGVFQRMAERMGDAEPGMEIIGETVQTSIQDNFEVGGRPSAWKPLSAKTIKAKGHDRILIDEGFHGGLLGSIHWEASPNEVAIGTNKAYAPTHNEGLDNMPQREFLLVQDEDWPEIRKQLRDFIMEGKA